MSAFEDGLSDVMIEATNLIAELTAEERAIIEEQILTDDRRRVSYEGNDLVVRVDAGLLLDLIKQLRGGS